MNKPLFYILFLVFMIPSLHLRAFEGSISITYKKDKREQVMDIKIKGDQVWMVSRFGGNKKYSGFLIDLKKRDLFTVAAPGKKVILHYHLDSILRFYERNNLKEGYKVSSGLVLKETEKVRVKEEISATRYESENKDCEAWLAEMETPLPDLIPFLRLMEVWGDPEHSSKTILEYKNKTVDKKEEVVTVKVVKEKIDDSWFTLPRDFKAVDFSKMMRDKKDSPELITLIKNFTEF